MNLALGKDDSSAFLLALSKSPMNVSGAKSGANSRIFAVTLRYNVSDFPVIRTLATGRTLSLKTAKMKNN
ncbi:hypothetical protein E2C01_075272 [Portunus trituberculatus]|uniref:Uncharacterized protein n=1 Tax=Portunus trituberculatus TaxID=210409 RepID=A0A5B7IFF0_PORTR|nr:hypothetical protein [Portunus trituberculatus]